MPGAVLGTPQVVSHSFFRRCDSQWTGEKTGWNLPRAPELELELSPQCQEEKQKERDKFLCADME